MSNGEVTVLAMLKAKKGLEEKVKDYAKALLAPTRQEQGCINYNLYTNKEDQSGIMFYENWTSQQALDCHLETPHLKTFVEKIKDFLAEPMSVTLWEKTDE